MPAVMAIQFGSKASRTGRLRWRVGARPGGCSVRPGEPRARAAGPSRRFSPRARQGSGRARRVWPGRSARGQIGIILAVAVERRQRPLEEGSGNRRAHVDAGVEQLGGDSRRAPGHLVQPRAQPVQPLIDRCGLLARQVAHRAPVAVGRATASVTPQQVGPPRSAGWLTYPPSRSIRSSTSFSIECSPSIAYPRRVAASNNHNGYA